MKKIICLLGLSLGVIHADYIWKNGKLIDFEKTPWMQPQEHYAHVLKACDDKKWLDLIENGVVITHHFKDGPFADETRFLLAKAFLEIKDYARAHDAVADYLVGSISPKHYEEVMSMKLEIANAFATGEIKNLIGLPGIPLWIDAKGEAVKLYEEISSALPTHVLAEKAILAKSNLEFELKEYRQAISTSESFLRKYGQSSYAPLAFEKIGVSYVKLVESEFLDPDLLSLAEMNLKKFQEQFPNHTKIDDIQHNLIVMKEHFAKNMLTTGLYYKKMKKYGASRFYFEKIMQTYPETSSAQEAEQILLSLPNL